METKSWWKKLKNNPLARFGATVLFILYVGVIFADFVAPYNPIASQPNGSLLPPTRVYLRNQGTGKFIGPHVYPTILGPVDIETGNRQAEIDLDRPAPLRLFVKGDEYRLFELTVPYLTEFSLGEAVAMEVDEFNIFKGIPLSRHLFGPVGAATPEPLDADVEAPAGADSIPAESDIVVAVPETAEGAGELTAVQTTPAYFNLFGTDNAARDIFSRLAFGGRISLSIGILGAIISFPIGLLVGGISGYFGGIVDAVLMRVVEVIMTIPFFYLLVTITAVLPAQLGSRRFYLIVFITSFIGWAGLARIIRGEVLSLKQRTFVQASKSMGGRSLHIITRHVLPQTATYVIIAATLSIPSYIVAEAVLSLLGLGIQEPDPSWGNMLSAGTNASVLVLNPWVVWPPAALIMITILCFNLVGDGLRDALDPRRLEEQ